MTVELHTNFALFSSLCLEIKQHPKLFNSNYILKVHFALLPAAGALQLYKAMRCTYSIFSW